MIPTGRASQKRAENNAKVLQAIRELGPISTSELYELFDAWSKNTVHLSLKALHQAQEVHISKWTRQETGKPGPMGRVWTAGPGTDAPRPKPKSHRVTSLEYYQKNSASISVRRHGSRSKLNASVNPFASLIR